MTPLSVIGQYSMVVRTAQCHMNDKLPPENLLGQPLVIEIV